MKFWQENIALFDKKDNLQVIKSIVGCLDSKYEQTVAVACYDLGEFARFYPHGKTFLNTLEVKDKLGELMSSDQATAQVKKEAIIAY